MDDDKSFENTFGPGLLGDHFKHGLDVLSGRGVYDEAVVFSEPGQNRRCGLHEVFQSSEWLFEGVRRSVTILSGCPSSSQKTLDRRPGSG